MRKIAFGSALFLSSAGGLIIEIVAGRLLAPYVGMSLYTWTAVIAVVLAGLSAGHWIGGRLAAPGIDSRRGGRRVASALALASVSSLGSLVLLRVVSDMLLGSGLPPIPAIVLLTAALFLLPSLFVGIVAPILTKLAVDDEPGAHGRVIGRMYALGTLGSIAGTLAAGYVFISWIGSAGTIIVVAGGYGILALAFAVADPARLVLMFFLAAAGGGLGIWGDRVQAFRSPCQVESDYFCIRIADYSPDDGRASRLMALDHLVHSINDRDDPGLLYSPYIHFVDEVVWARRGLGVSNPLAAFFIGGGGYSLPRAWAHDYPAARLMVAEIDPAVTAAARDFMYLDPDLPQFTIVHRDARAALQSLPTRPAFDVIFGDAFRDISIPPHLVTREFHGQVARRLRTGGLYAINVVDRGVNPRFLFSLVQTLWMDFSHVEVWVERGEADSPGRVTFVVLASNRPTPAATLASRRGLERTWVRLPESHLRSRIIEALVPVLSDDFAPVDRLMAGPLLEAEY